jgi:hypothetical protein
MRAVLLLTCCAVVACGGKVANPPAAPSGETAARSLGSDRMARHAIDLEHMRLVKRAEQCKAKAARLRVDVERVAEDDRAQWQASADELVGRATAVAAEIASAALEPSDWDSQRVTCSEMVTALEADIAALAKKLQAR